MGKYWKKTNLVTFYASEKYHDVIDRWIELAKKEPNLMRKVSQKTVGSKGIFSLSMIYLIVKEVGIIDPEFIVKWKRKYISDESKEEIKPEVKEDEASN